MLVDSIILYGHEIWEFVMNEESADEDFDNEDKSNVNLL